MEKSMSLYELYIQNVEEDPKTNDLVILTPFDSIFCKIRVKKELVMKEGRMATKGIYVRENGIEGFLTYGEKRE